jgi:TM2 domain-containing membrane protein YozV
LDYENLDDTTQEKILQQSILCSVLADKKNDAAYFLTQYKNYVKDSLLNKKDAYLFPLVYLQNEEWDNAYKSMLQQSDTTTRKKIDSIWQNNFPTFRNPKTATVLSSILPGSGQCYAGKVGFGLINLLGVAGSGYFLAWHLINHYYMIGAITSGGLLSRFYLGGLKTSRNFTEKNNDKKAFIFRQKMSSYWMGKVNGQ